MLQEIILYVNLVLGNRDLCMLQDQS